MRTLPLSFRELRDYFSKGGTETGNRKQETKTGNRKRKTKRANKRLVEIREDIGTKKTSGPNCPNYLTPFPEFGNFTDFDRPS